MHVHIETNLSSIFLEQRPSRCLDLLSEPPLESKCVVFLCRSRVPSHGNRFLLVVCRVNVWLIMHVHTRENRKDRRE